MRLIGTLFIVLFAIASSVSAGISMRQYSEVVIDETIDASGRQYLTDIDGDGYPDIYFNTNTKIGWYSGYDAVIKSSIPKVHDFDICREYAIGYFDGDDQPDYVEAVIVGEPLALLFVYYLSSDQFSGGDTVYVTDASGYDPTYDAFQFHYYHVIGPYIVDSNHNGIDEVQTGYYYYDNTCIPYYCFLDGTTEVYFTHERGYAPETDSSISRPTYLTFGRGGNNDPASLDILNLHWYHEMLANGYWEKTPLAISTYSDSMIGELVLESNDLCVAGASRDFEYSLEQVSSQISDTTLGFDSPTLLCQVMLKTFSWEGGG